jgi:glyoxylate reductase
VKRKVVIPVHIPQSGFLNGLKGWNIVFPKGKKHDREEFLREIKDTDVIVSIFGLKLDNDAVNEAADLKMIANYGAGYDNVDVDFCTKKGILVTNCPGPVTEPTAELAFALMLAVARRVVEMNIRLNSPEPLKWGVMRNLSSTLVGKTLGIVGMGAIGKAVARRAVASGMKVVYHNRHKPDKETEESYNATWVEFDELLSTSDYVSLNVPLTPETKGMMGEEEFMKMKDSAYLINTARGAVVKEQELIKALRDGVIAGAGLDVFENEPDIPEEFLEMKNVVVMPHLGSATMEAREEMSRVVALNIATAFSGEMPPNIVNREVWDEWRKKVNG